MALKTLIIENFRGKSQHIEFNSELNFIKGRNGAGKSTVKEAICFALCGTDSVGTRNPKHLISNDSTSTKVTLITDKAEISRSLTRAGNGTLRLSIGGMATQYTQTQFETLIGHSDVVLSCFLPGFFIRLSTEKKQKVISDLMPKIDRAELFASMAGHILSPEHITRYGIERRADLVASSVSVDRRMAEREQARLVTEHSQKEKTVQQVHAQIAPDTCGPILEKMAITAKAWDRYQSDMNSWSERSMAIERAIQDNALKATRREKLREQLNSLELIPVPESEALIFDAELSRLHDQLIPEPIAPALIKTIDDDHCPTCAQAVGLKHREKVQKANLKIKQNYDEQLSSTQAHNCTLYAEMAKIKERRDTYNREAVRITNENNKISNIIRAFEMEIASLVDIRIPDETKKPTQPTEEFDVKEFRNIKAKHAEYLHNTAVVEYQINESYRAREELPALHEAINNHNNIISMYELIEKTFKMMPQEELKIQSSALEMGEGIQFVVGDEVKVFQNDMPYELLSTGQRMKLDIKLCLKLNSLMTKPLNMVFVDDANLVDLVPVGTHQMFVALVVEGSDLLINPGGL